MNLDKTIKEEPCDLDKIIVPLETDPLCMSNNSHCYFSADNRIGKYEISTRPIKAELLSPVAVQGEEQRQTHEKGKLKPRQEKEQTHVDNGISPQFRKIISSNEKVVIQRVDEKKSCQISDQDSRHFRDSTNKNSYWCKIKSQWSCPMCNNSYARLMMFIEHWNAAHKEDTMTICKRDRTASNGFKLIKIKATDLAITKPNSKIIQSNSNTTTLKKSTDVKIEGNYPCPLCSNSFTVLNDMINHIDIHKNSKQFCCSVCNLYFETYNALHKHKQTHEKEKVNPVQEKEQTNIDNVITPQPRKRKQMCEKWIHQKSIQFSCSVCNLQLKTGNEYNKHMQTHNKEKDNLGQEKETDKVDDVISPQFRNRKFFYETSFESNPVNERSFSCPLCKIAFVKTITFMEHLKDVHRVDNTTSCPICDRDFRDFEYASLAVHMWDHNRSPHIIEKYHSHHGNRGSKYVKYIDSNNKISEYKANLPISDYKKIKGKTSSSEI